MDVESMESERKLLGGKMCRDPSDFGGREKGRNNCAEWKERKGRLVVARIFIYFYFANNIEIENYNSCGNEKIILSFWWGSQKRLTRARPMEIYGFPNPIIIDHTWWMSGWYYV